MVSTVKNLFTLFGSLLIICSAYQLYGVVSVSTLTITHQSVWALFYFSHGVYTLSLFSAILYVLPNVASFSMSSAVKSSSSFSSLEGLDVLKLMMAPVISLLTLHFSWSGPVLTAWFGHLVFSMFQFKVTFLLFGFFLTYIIGVLTTTHYSSMLSYDFSIVTFNFFFWSWLTFFSNNLFTFIFFLEVLSASITLLLITSVFSSSHFYNNLAFDKHSYFHQSMPTAFLQTLLFFFWVTLVSSIMLFLFLLVFYIRLLTFDWNITDSILIFLVECSSMGQLFSLSFSWLLLLVCLFIKCGTVPFYFWKPVVFKGMSITSLFFYVYVYYFSMFLYFIYVLFFYLNEFFMFNLYLIVTLTVIATLGLTLLLLESFYVKAFLALSSILNSIFIFFALCSYHATDVLFFL